jgi:hypothetical protein
MEWKKANPIYPVADVGSSREWYGRVFGFEPQVVNPPGDVPVYAVLVTDASARRDSPPGSRSSALSNSQLKA